MMRILLIIYLIGTTVLAGLYLYDLTQEEVVELSPLSETPAEPDERPLDQYRYDTLAEAEIEPEGFRILKEDPAADPDASFSAYLAVLETAEGDVTGLLHVPDGLDLDEPVPYLVLFRGFVDRSVYQTGIGSRPIATRLADSGYVTFAPDFLGYGDSDDPSENPMEERFQAYPTALAAVRSAEVLNQALRDEDINAQVDPDRVGLWGHSNGGHIALSVLAITQADYPTVLWAPVSKPFPYSILFYTDEFDDQGKGLRDLISGFEQDYDVLAYSTNEYYDQITASIQVHQGYGDRPVPYWWSEQLVADLRQAQDDAEGGTDATEGVDSADEDQAPAEPPEFELFLYEESDHNLAPAGWGPAAARTVGFFDEELE